MHGCDNNSKNSNQCHGQKAGLFFSGALIGLGSVFLLSRLGYLGDINPTDLWPCLLIWAGLTKLAYRSFGGGFLFIAAGITLQAHYLGRLPLEWSIIWPALLIVAGFSILFTTAFKKRRTKPATISESFLDISVMLGGREEVLDNVEFEGGEISCIMSGLELDFRGATIKDQEARINISVVMGGIEMRVPDNWIVVLRGTPIMGGFENKTRPSTDSDSAPRLIVEGSVVMGGVEVRN